jgi:hypothetical protein
MEKSLVLRNADLNFLKGEAENVIDRIKLFESSNRYLRAAEESKTKKNGLSGNEEREAFQRAASAASDIRSLTTSSLKIVKHLQSTGGWSHIWTNLERVLIENQELKANELWETIMSKETTREYIKSNLGLGDAFESISELIGQAQNNYRIVDGCLHIDVGQENERKVVPVVMESINEQNWQAEDLWDQDFIDIAIEALERPGALGVTVFTEEDGLERRTMESFDPPRILVLEAIRAVEYMENSASLIRYHGLPAARGEFGISAGLLILGGFIALAIGVTILILCGEDIIEVEDVCEAGEFLTIVGGICFGAGILVKIGAASGSILIIFTGSDGSKTTTEIEIEEK